MSKIDYKAMVEELRHGDLLHTRDLAATAIETLRAELATTKARLAEAVRIMQRIKNADQQHLPHTLDGEIWDFLAKQEASHDTRTIRLLGAKFCRTQRATANARAAHKPRGRW